MERLGTAIAIGLMAGLILIGVFTVYFIVSRSYRWRRNPVALGIGYLLIPGTVLGCFGLIQKALLRFGLVDHNIWLTALSAFALMLLGGVAGNIRSEMKWRRMQTNNEKIKT